MTAREVAVTFDGSFDGFLSVVFACYYEKIVPSVIQEESHAQLTIADDTCFIKTDENRAKRVFNALNEKLNHDIVNNIYGAFLSFEDDRFMVLLQYIKMAFSVGNTVDDYQQIDFVRRFRKIARHVWREWHLLRGFCRFAETKQGVFYCEITPNNNVLSLLADHFSQRLMGQAWIIHDKTRHQAAIFNGTNCAITAVPHDATVELADGEEETQELWVAFFNALWIKQRTNLKLQRQLMPLYFRKNMTEFIKAEKMGLAAWEG